MSKSIATTYITLSLEQLKEMVKNAEVGGVSQVKIAISYEVLDR